MKAAVVSLLVLSAVAMGGIGIYSTQASADMSASDGYGITAATR